MKKSKVKEWLKRVWVWFKGLFRTRYKVTVSFNRVWGDSDDKEYLAKKIIKAAEKHLKFIDQYGKVIEHRSSTGLHYIIEDE
ncbi:uncharacterized protein METZ01_LOCUS196093 [marine metagenome]|uniref:Uncharacterized protein n=1 Tax=marine metagenome TaxID=408172 RepID=A0A382DYI5_9ZZZZ|tara:strand:+ start:630 stop:875 length:246 start_codon:yes stop_codon:yes gene_type:complete